MKEKVLYTGIVLLAGVLVWNNLSYLRVPAPCEKPIAYTVGVFDRRFGISQKEFLDALSLAEAIWEKPLGIELFTYAPEREELSINLIYDYRQETTNVLSDLGGALEQNEATYKMLQRRYAELKAGYEDAKALYDTRVTEFNAKNRAYEAQVEVWNSGKRTSRAQFNQLEKARTALETEAEELKILEARLNEIVREINALVSRLNQMARSLNLGVETYNTIGVSRGESFTGGVYYSAEGERGIDIYEFSSRDKLVRVLTHELGHALGLDHNDNPEAMMYHLNKDDAGILSETDLSALKALCGVK